MWRTVFIFIASAPLGIVAAQSLGQEVTEPYGSFDAIAEGAQSSEARRLALIDSQLDTVNDLRSITLPVQRRVYTSDPGIAGVYAYGRRGLFGLRPRGYVVIRRAPIVVYRRTPSIGPPFPPLDPYGTAYGGAVRQPIGHESVQTGPNRWEYRPLYAGDDPSFDQTHREIEERLGHSNDRLALPRRVESDDEFSANNRAQRSTARPTANDRADEPEELPLPDVALQPRRAARPPLARDVARDPGSPGELREESRVDRETPTRRATSEPPPPPKPDPAVHGNKRDVERNGARANVSEKGAKGNENGKEAPANDDAAEVLGPVLRNPSTGTREF